MRSPRVWPITVFVIIAGLLFAPRVWCQGLELKWNKVQKQKVEEALALVAQDPILALSKFREVLEGQDRKPKPDQKAWLEQQISTLRPQVASILKRDFDAAVATSDLRAMIFASSASAEFAGEALATEPVLAEVKSKWLSGIEPAPPIWKITGLSAMAIEGRYRDGTMGGLLISAPEGHKLVRVKARVENVSTESDKAYTLRALGGVKSILGRMYAPSGSSEPYRWLDDSFIYLVDPTSGLISRTHVCEGSELASSVLRTAGDSLVFPPKPLKKGEATELDLLFILPQESQEYRLFVLGSAPVALGKLP